MEYFDKTVSYILSKCMSSFIWIIPLIANKLIQAQPYKLKAVWWYAC